VKFFTSDFLKNFGLLFEIGSADFSWGHLALKEAKIPTPAFGGSTIS
jgi:hypothetical protein